MKKFWSVWRGLFLVQASPDPGWSRGRRAAYYAWRWGWLLLAGVCMGMVLLTLAAGMDQYTQLYLWSYFRGENWLFVQIMNVIPVVVLIVLFYGVTGNAWSAFLWGGGIALGFSLGNFYKLVFRSDPLYFEDLLILNEARNMVTEGDYELFLNLRIELILLCMALGAAALRLLVPGKNRDRKARLATALAALAAAGALTPVYLNESLYQRYVQDEQWFPTRDYILHGFTYPFLHSISRVIDTPPEGYKKSDAKALLAEYPDADIPEDRKVSLICLMREAYMDFSRFDIEGLDESCYDLYHALEAESYTGDLVTNIFAGGTVDSERCFLSGEYQLKQFRSDTNSYVWYLRGQGYDVQGSHPYHEWFYNRQHINRYLGFDEYRFLEGDYERLTSSQYAEDGVLLPEIYADWKRTAAAGTPCFSFSVNIQSHSPYETEAPAENSWLHGENYSDGCRYAMDHYLDIIRDSDEQLALLVDRLRDDPEPVVLVTFGDHLPWMGVNNAYYDEMGLNIDSSNEEGFFRHYTTRYLIWANGAARELLGTDLQGEGPAVSPCYLMDVVFEQLGWEGPGYMQAMREMRQVFPVVSTKGRTVTDGVLSDEIPEARRELYQDFLDLQYYWQQEFLYSDIK